jgi:hypothetical protein
MTARAIGKTGLITIGQVIVVMPFVIFVLGCAMTMAMFYLWLRELAGCLAGD